MLENRDFESFTVGRAMCNDSRLLCPRCDGPAKSCQFVEIRESCTLVKFTSLFDNKWTVWFALFIAVWAQLFCELWKRRQKWLTDAWNLVDESGDAIRIDFEKRTKVKIAHLYDNIYIILYILYTMVLCNILEILYLDNAKRSK